MTWLLHLDSLLFHWVNSDLSNPFFDVVLPFCRERWFWAPFYLFLLAFVFLNYGRRGWLLVLGIAVTVALSDFTSSSLIKKNVQRLRPCNDPAMEEPVRLRVPSCGSGYSFTSSHASNHFAVAVVLIGILGIRNRWGRALLLGWAGLIAFSQVYVGVHYPGDVLCGAGMGSAIGWWVTSTFQRRGWKLAT